MCQRLRRERDEARDIEAEAREEVRDHVREIAHLRAEVERLRGERDDRAGAALVNANALKATGREMTLEEYVAKLKPYELAHREWAGLVNGAIAADRALATLRSAVDRMREERGEALAEVERLRGLLRQGQRVMRRYYAMTQTQDAADWFRDTHAALSEEAE
jgi:hypothetical protein